MIPYGQKIESIKKNGDLYISGVAAPDLTHYGFAATEGHWG
jgi:hypothetical protein